MCVCLCVWCACVYDNNIFNTRHVYSSTHANQMWVLQPTSKSSVGGSQVALPKSYHRWGGGKSPKGQVRAQLTKPFFTARRKAEGPWCWPRYTSNTA